MKRYTLTVSWYEDEKGETMKMKEKRWVKSVLMSEYISVVNIQQHPKVVISSQKQFNQRKQLIWQLSEHNKPIQSVF